MTIIHPCLPKEINDRIWDFVVDTKREKQKTYKKITHILIRHRVPYLSRIRDIQVKNITDTMV